MKEAKKMNKLKNRTMKVQAHAMVNMVATILRKVAILEDQVATMALFTMPEDQLVLEEAREDEHARS
jgi:Trm5-related predicted tRNA methylase